MTLDDAVVEQVAAAYGRKAGRYITYFDPAAFALDGESDPLP